MKFRKTGMSGIYQDSGIFQNLKTGGRAVMIEKAIRKKEIY